MTEEKSNFVPYTNGPWKFYGPFIIEDRPAGRAIVEKLNSRFGKSEESRANLALMAKSPDMYALLSEVAGYMSPHREEHGSQVESPDVNQFFGSEAGRDLLGRIKTVLEDARLKV